MDKIKQAKLIELRNKKKLNNKKSELAKLKQVLVVYGKQNNAKIDKEISIINAEIIEIEKSIADKQNQMFLCLLPES